MSGQYDDKVLVRNSIILLLLIRFNILGDDNLRWDLYFRTRIPV